MTKKYLKLTADQIARKVIFSSQLIARDINQNQNSTVHEVHRTDINQAETIKRLLDDKFFNNSPYKYNLIRQ
jgi:hypothetical protein